MKKQNKHTNRRKIRHILLIVLGAVIIAGGIWYFGIYQRIDQSGIPVGRVTYQFVSSRPEASLYYPGANVFQKFGLGQRQQGTVAFAGAIMTTNDSQEKVYAWYDQWLTAHGYHPDTSWGALAATQQSLRTYSKGERERFEVAINDPTRLGWTLGKKIPTDMTVFEFSYLIRSGKK